MVRVEICLNSLKIYFFHNTLFILSLPLSFSFTKWERGPGGEGITSFKNSLTIFNIGSKNVYIQISCQGACNEKKKNSRCKDL